MRRFLAVLGSVLVAGCLAASEPQQAGPPTLPQPSPPFECDTAKSFRSANVSVVIETSRGAIGLVLYGDPSPLSVCNFLRYVEEDFYDNTVWHRVCPHVIQAGGVTLAGQQKPAHEPIQNEANQSQLRNYERTVGMARATDPDSATSHFYINLRDNLYLDYDGQYPPGYAVFGNVTSGWDVVQQISGTPTLPSLQGCTGRPVPSQETLIRDVRLVDGASST